MPKITDAAYGDLTSYVATFKLIGHDPTEGSVANQTKRLELQDFLTMLLGVQEFENVLYQTLPRPGMMLNGKLAVTVATNNLTVALKTWAGSDPSATDTVAININGTIRTVTSALSITLAAATNWFNAGSSELATKEIDYFCYAVWDSNSSAVALAPARYPAGTLVSDFSSTSTNEKYMGNYANYTSTDDVCVIGRFAATLSAGAGYTWTVPTFTSANLVQEPIKETRQLSWTPTHSRTGGAYTNAPTVSDAKYQIVNNRMTIYERHTQNATPGSSGNQTVTLPFSNAYSVSQLLKALNGTTVTQMLGAFTASSNVVTLYKYDGTAEATASQPYIFQDMVII